ncbi:MAG: heavy metal-binding domain-containing protein [Planctomycetota bacterium]
MEIVNLLFQCGLPLLLLFLGLLVGGAREQAHLRNLARRERVLSSMFVTDIRAYAPQTLSDRPPALVMGEAIIATDYLKSFLSKIRKILGGELKTYQSLMLRARREALLRMLEHARQQGYNAVCNVRLDSADIGGSSSGRGVALAGMMATGTAYTIAGEQAT